MTKTIQKLDNNISTLRPDFYNCLKKPLDETAITKLEEKFKVQIPDDLKALYQWKNGQSDDCYDSFVNNSMFIPLNQSLAIAKELTAMIGTDFEIENWWNENWLPVFDNDGGSYICYDLSGIFTGEKGQLLEFWKSDNDRNVIAPNLESFLIQLNNYYETTPEEDFDDYFEVEAPQKFPKRFIVK
ncbi:SMI1/KNR4 family protein [Flavobacterium pedocola]